MESRGGYGYLGQMSFWVDFPNSADDELFSGLFGFIFDPFLVGLSQLDHFIHFFLVFPLLFFEALHFQAVDPFLFVEIQQHLLLVVVLSVVDCQRVIGFVQSMRQSLLL